MSKGKDISTMFTKEENKKNGRLGYGLATPESCEGCCMFCYTYHRFQCLITGKTIENSTDRPERCPMRPLPDKIKTPKLTSGYDLGYKDGYDKCLAEITGEVK